MAQLKAMFSRAKQKTLDAYLPEFNAQLDAGGINTPKRLAYFFATVNVETGGMTNFVESFRYRTPAAAKSSHKCLRKMDDKAVIALGS